ncbi:MAG: hypothetical protein HKN36_13520 [Hellea sp.]|nr:hypothetical protein [Hellea sp.]
MVDEALELWLGIGQGWAEFWASSPKIATQIIGSRKKHAHQTIVMQAWYTEYMARQKRLKNLNHYLDSPKQKKPLKTGEAMNAAPWLALFGPASLNRGR